MSDRIQFRRDTAERWAQFNPFLLEGEIGVVLDNPNQYKVGDGVHYWNDLPLRGFNGNIVNQMGDSEDSVMSQKAVTDAINSNTAYLYCTSNAGDDKVVQNTGFNINNGIRLLIKMQYANTKTSNVTLQVGTTDAKPIIYNGAAVTNENTWDANDVLDVYYDGNNYQACLYSSAQFATGEKVGDVGIDDEPTAESENLVKSGGVYAEIQTITDKITNNFVPINDINFYKTGYIDSTGNYVYNSSGKLYRYKLKKNQKIMFHSDGGTTTQAAISFSVDEEPETFTMILRNVGQDAYYSYVLPSDGYVYLGLVVRQVGEVWIVNPQEPELNEFGVYKYTFGENAIIEYVNSEFSNTELWGSGYLNSSGSISSASNYYYSKKYIPVLQGSYIQAGIVISGNARICYYNSKKEFLSSVSATGTGTSSTLRVIPEDASYMRFCTSDNSTNRLSWIYQNEGKQFVDIKELNDINSKLETISTNLATVDKSINNNLLNESNKIDGWQVRTSTNGINYITDNSLYGQANVRYVVPVDNSAKILHIKFKFKFTQYLSGASANTNHHLLIVGSTDSYRAALRQTSFTYNSNTYVLQRQQNFVVQQGSNVSSVSYNNTNLKQFEGAIAYSLEYKGQDYSSAVNYKLQLSETGINVYDSDGTTILETIAVDADELVSSVVDKVNSTSNYLKAVPYEVDGVKYTDCVYGSVKFPLCVSSSGSRPWMINKLLDENWHTFEAVLDYTNLISYSGIDGTTVVRQITERDDKTLFIGGALNTSLYKMVPVVFRDLHVGYGYEDAEIITYPNNVSGNLTRLISNESPYLIIFEGHGIENKMNKDMPTGSSSYMSTSTDALRTVFDALRSKGFVPISWKDIVNWKKYGGTLPKRCYTLMFDDFRIENYMNLDLRKPFVEYGVKPGLAIITGNAGETRSRGEEVTIDGQTWTLGECFDAMIKAGWYPCSHTKNHTVVRDIKDMELFSFLKDCIYSCDKLGIYDDIIVYPKGVSSAHKNKMMMASGFAIGVQVAVNGYNSLSSLDFNLIRNEIGSRESIDDILARIV